MRRAIRAAALAASAAAALPWTAEAQTAGPPPEPVERHLILSAAEIADEGVVVDGVVRSKKQGNRPAEFTLDICFPIRADTGEIDRFTAPLRQVRNGFSASGQSLLRQVRTELTLSTQSAGAQSTMAGELRYGDLKISLREHSLDWEEGGAEHLFEKLSPPAGTLAPNEILAKIEIGAVRPVLDLLRRHGAVLPAAQLVPGCADHREGKQYLRVLTSPARVAELAAALKAAPGVASADIAEETSLREDGVKLPAGLATASERAVVDAFTAAARKALGTDRPADVKAAPATGEYVVLLTRDTPSAGALGLAEAIAVTVMVAADPYDKAKRVLFVTQVGSKFVDPSPTPLQLAQEMFETVSYTEIQPRRVSAALAAAFAAEIGGEVASGSGRR
ncbi:hypothetical protein [Enterovirga sp.]|uniref:hypothetical protein n=1 Tax=Enterovirga sp. TaxID=2026350 RepID=UPI002606A171|nr:hypothetical protein [Enterovirga sp.]MDB5592320.1 hypothetical protein [Enterovirga sp.]